MASSRKRPSARRIAVALSGGVDSVVASAPARRIAPGSPAVHVHHGLSPNAEPGRRSAGALCKRLGVPLVVKREGRQARRGPRGRGARGALRGFRETPSADVLALAHHLDDQAETVLLQLLRGAGLRGAAGMARESQVPRQSAPPAAARRAARGDRGLRAPARPAVDRGRVERRRSADRNFLRRASGSAARGALSARGSESLARAARHFATHGGGCARSCCGSFYKRRACARRARRSWWRC